jgi:hypothetical protein
MSEIINWYDVIPKEFLNNTENPNVGYHNLKVPFYGLISGNSGSGKSQMLLSIIKAFSDKSKNKKKQGTFFSCYIFVKSADEPIYRWLKTISPNIHVLEDLSKLDIDKNFDKDLNHLLVFDDMVLEKNQKPMCDAYIRARKKNISCLYLTQDFHRVPTTIRRNCRYLFIMKLSGNRETCLVMREYGSGLSKKQLVGMYDYATRGFGCPLLIDLEAPIETKYRRGLLEFLNPDDFL